MKLFNNYILNKLFLMLLISAFLISGCAKATLTIRSPAEINTRKIKNVAVGGFEIGQMMLKFKTERNGVWQTHPVLLSEEQQKSISRSVRARVINLLTATPYFKVIFSDEFEKLANDAALQQLVSVRGYKTKNVDAVINGKLWLEIERTDGVDLSKEGLEYFRPPRSRNSIGLNLTVDQVVWWPYKSTRGTLGLEIKMTRLLPTEVVATTFETRTYSQRIGGRNGESFQQIADSFTSVLSTSDTSKIDSIESSADVLPSFEQIIADMALSIASGFVRRVAVTEKVVSYPIAEGSFPNAKILIEAGAYDVAIDQLQQATAENSDPNDLYNLGLCFEAIGDYGLAHTTYREAWKTDPENLLFAQGLGRIERLRRENPQLQRQLESR
ncbi:MAG: tetratricopeptide repeat protein [Deltaproteobacteria bacterium]|jgi:tetratricopeptide (TPR) repeat protein|nr:tetratricopeptide repeat protein [Deltaproteobacteria bacterium]